MRYILALLLTACAADVSIPDENEPYDAPTWAATPQRYEWEFGSCTSHFDCEYHCLQVRGPDRMQRYCQDGPPVRDARYACLGASVCVAPCTATSKECIEVYGKSYEALSCDEGCPQGMHCADPFGICMWPKDQ